MARVVALLRGVNVGGRQLKMADLRTGLEAAGCTGVATYVQSGNVVLTPPTGAGRQAADWLGEVISGLAGFDVGVVVRTASDLATVVEGNPYPDAGGSTLHVVFCERTVPTDLLSAIDLDAVAPEHATVAGREIYLSLPDGMGRATLPTLVERAGRGADVGVATTRNWNTVLRLRAMADA